MKKNKSVLFSLVFTIAILTSACDGSSGSPGDGGGNNPPSGDLNSGLSGKLFFKAKTERTDGSKIDEAWVMDIASGKYTKVPNTNWADHEERFPSNWSRVVVSPVDYDGTEFVVEIPACMYSPDRTCIAVQNMDGSYLDQFEIFGDDSVLVRMSRDLQHIALVNYENMSSSSDRWLEIYNRSGRLLSSSKLENRFISDFAWRPDGSIIYGIWRSFYFTAPYSTQAKNILTLPGSLQGDKIGQISVSPDGERLAFTVDGLPYIANIDGTHIRKLAAVSYKKTAVNNIVWSPDGQWILLGEGGGRRAGSGASSCWRQCY